MHRLRREWECHPYVLRADNLYGLNARLGIERGMLPTLAGKRVGVMHNGTGDDLPGNQVLAQEKIAQGMCIAYKYHRWHLSS